MVLPPLTFMVGAPLTFMVDPTMNVREWNIILHAPGVPKNYLTETPYTFDKSATTYFSPIIKVLISSHK